jgi:hypothetical protein
LDDVLERAQHSVSSRRLTRQFLYGI